MNNKKIFYSILLFSNLYTIFLVGIMLFLILFSEQDRRERQYQSQKRIVEFIVDDPSISLSMKIKILQSINEQIAVSYEDQNFNMILVKSLSKIFEEQKN